MTEKTAIELLDEAAQEPTLDDYLRRDPATLSPKDIANVVIKERKMRAMFIEAEAAKKGKKKGEEASLPNVEAEGDGDAD